MPREVQEPTLDENGYERHPAFGLIGASRVQCGPPGATLFDSDIQHGHTVVVRVHGAVRKRELKHDWVGTDARQSYIEVELSEAQWASFVSSMNTGDGVPCTVRRRDGERLPEMPYAPRLQESMREVREATAEEAARVRAALDAYEAHKTKANLFHLRAMVNNLPSNLEFAGKSLAEHTENVVQRARADLEAMVVSKARQLGIEPSELGRLELTTGDDDA